MSKLALARMSTLLLILLALPSAPAVADEYDNTIKVFRDAGQSAGFFSTCYGYAVFPSVGKGGLIVGGAHGSGHVYEQGTYVGDASITEVSVGLQAGGQAFSEIIFFQNKDAFDEFTSGDFKFSAEAQAVAIQSEAKAQATTGGGSNATAGTGKGAATAGAYHKGMAVFTVTKGGAMVAMNIAGQKFKYEAKKGK